MNSPEKLSFPLETQRVSRRQILKAMGLLPVASALGADTNPEYYEIHNIEPHVDIEKREIKQPVDLVASGTWGMEGATVRDGALVLAPLDRHIINKRAGRRDPNPPVNLYGTRLEADGSFALGAQVAHAPGAAVSLRLYAGDPPLRFDDFSFLQGAEVECRLDAETLTINTRQGDQSVPQELHRFPLPSADNRQVEVQRTHDGTLRFMADGQTIGHAPANLLAGKNIWFGLSSEQGESRVSSLIARPLGSSQLKMADIRTLEVTQPTPEGLQTIIGKDKLVIGTGASLSHLVADKKYAQLMLGSEFGRITPENGMKPQDIQPIEGVFSFQEADALVDAAIRHGLEVHGHAAMYDKALPQWMNDLPHQTEADKQRLREVLWTHIHRSVGHFKGRVQSWDVWNELLSGFNNEVTLSSNPFTRGLGEEALDIAFHAARAADPNAKLFINDFGLETNPQGRGLFMLGLVTRARLRGVPIDGVGIQGHVYEMPRDSINPLVLATLMATAAAQGLEVRVTELDVTGQNGSAAQAKQFAEVAKVCLRAPNCTGYTVWGPGDKYGSTISVEDGRLKPGNALLYDAQFRTKAARYAVAEVLRAA